MNAELFTRARGALLGLVAGAQIGRRTAHLGTPEAIKALFPRGVRDLTPPPPAAPGDAWQAVEDDAAGMALCLAESVVACGTFDVTDVARRWVQWMQADHGRVSATTRRALERIAAGTEPFEAGRLARGGPSATGTGSVLRTVPVALRFHDSVERLIRVSAQQAAITHADERCLWSAAAMSVAVRELLQGNAYFVDEVLHHLRDLAPRVLTDAIHRAPREEQGELVIVAEGQGGDVVRSVEVAFWFATHGRAFEEALVLLAEAGGDTEANAGLAGALLGARDGEAGIPPRWLDQLADAARIRTLADALVAGAA